MVGSPPTSVTPKHLTPPCCSPSTDSAPLKTSLTPHLLLPHHPLIYALYIFWVSVWSQMWLYRPTAWPLLPITRPVQEGRPRSTDRQKTCQPQHCRTLKFPAPTHPFPAAISHRSRVKQGI